MQRMLGLHNQAGNRVATELLKVGQARLQVGAVDDPCEIEADQVASQVVSFLSGGGTPRSVEGESVSRVARRAIGAEGGPVGPETEAAIAAARGGGRPLDDGTRSAMEGAFGGADFSGVRLHAGAEAADLNRQLSAEAFTIGSDIFFSGGLPGQNQDGQSLLAHELTHTIQQGSAGVHRSVVQRMPRSSVLVSQAGKKRSEGKKIFGKVVGATTKYNNVFKAVDSYNDYTKNTVIADTPQGLSRQLTALNAMMDAIVNSIREYVGKEDSEEGPSTVFREMANVIIPAERRVIADVAAKWARRETVVGVGRPKWMFAIPDDPTKYSFSMPDMKLEEVSGDNGGGESGNNKAVSKVDHKGRSGYFATDSQTGRYDETFLPENRRPGDEEQTYGNPRGILEIYGVKDENLRLANRSIAMSRLDALLNAGVIARTEMALKGGQIGAFMEEAKGQSALNTFLAHGEDKLESSGTLPRLLSKLQLIDLIAGQVDRHANNYFIAYEGEEVKSVTGIDLDMSWGTDQISVEHGSFDRQNKRRADHLRGMSRFVDEEMALKIINLKPDDLRLVLVDLLPENAIEAAVQRLLELQVRLKELQKNGELLKPNQWTETVKKKLVEEDSSYYKDIIKGATKWKDINI